MASKFFTTILIAAVFNVAMSFPITANSASKASVSEDLVISTTGESSTIQKAYYYGSTTILEFSSYPMYFSVEDRNGKKITNFRREGKYARIPGRYDYLLASVDGAPVIIKTATKEKLFFKSNSILPGYEFSYELSGDQEAMPLQIFDDGKKTYVQFKSNQDQPAVFLELPEKATLLKFHSESGSPYKSMDGIQSSYQFILGQYTAKAKYVGKEKRENAAPGAITKESRTDALADITQTNAPIPPSAHALTHQDTNAKEASTTADLTPNKPVAKPIPVWTLNDGHTILQNLKNWADKAGWKIIWNLTQDWTVPAGTHYTGEFPEAAGLVIKTLAKNGALIRVKFYEGNKTMVVSSHGANAL